ncbi:MAG: hypothetical protein JWN23_1681 [Rhodocyclales bacterium]|nr:hypothetical protein [Rhodocyclales bacterium]
MIFCLLMRGNEKQDLSPQRHRGSQRATEEDHQQLLSNFTAMQLSLTGV